MEIGLPVPLLCPILPEILDPVSGFSEEYPGAAKLKIAIF
jgi:hypothetical protein